MRLTAGQQHRASIASRNYRMNNTDCWGNHRPSGSHLSEEEARANLLAGLLKRQPERDAKATTNS